MLVVVQVALAVVLLVGSGLMTRTFQALRHVDPGFDPNDALTMPIAIPDAQVKDPVAVAQLEQSILDKIREIPGVVSAGMTAFIPTDPGGSLYRVYARDKTYDKVPPLRRQKFISPGLLAALGSRLVAGREFTWTDVYERRSIAMVSENLARELWGDPRVAIGKEITPNQKDPRRAVIGVVADERSEGMQQQAPASAYYPLLMYHFNNEPVAVLAQSPTSFEAGARDRRACWPTCSAQSGTWIRACRSLKSGRSTRFIPNRWNVRPSRW